MAEPHLMLCGGLRHAAIPPGWRRLARTTLQIGDSDNVHLRVVQLTQRMITSVSDLAMDLLEIAAYVFAADQALGRGGTVQIDYGKAWRRRLRFLIPVRCLERWQDPGVQIALRAALEFLTDDEYEFSFRQAPNPARPESCLFDAIEPDGTEFQEVMLFSGGLDSLCGAVEEVLIHEHRVVLVSHHSANQVWGRQQELFGAIRAKVKRRRSRPLHVGVTINKGEELNHEFTQRSRSFVFASVAAVVARQVGLGRIRFYENGCTSLNLPVSPELVGARASRTTHPQSLARFGRLFSLLFDGTFEVQNPYQVKTKAEMLRQLHARGHADLCRLTCSCGHVWGQPEATPHCGRCSQCVERRISVLAAGLTDLEDPLTRYVSDPITGERAGPDLTFIERYIGCAREITQIGSPRALAIRFPEVNEAIPYLGLGSSDEAARFVHDLSRRNAAGISDAVCTALAINAGRLFHQQIPARSLLRVAMGQTAPPPITAVQAANPVVESGLVVDRSRQFYCHLGLA